MRQRSLALLATLAIAASTALAEDGRRDAVRVALEPVVTGGLSSPVYITHSRDGSGRLFVVEQTGRIRILCGCSPELRVFLDVSSKVVSGGEQGLLGLAFHPSYRQNRRFFVNYTRRGDGATVVSEFRASATDPLAADPAETVLLTISQPFSNHNGGMIEFGPDGYLYIGMGDGGSGNDPGNRAQNTGELLGKMLRIDVDRQGAGTPYAIPPDNPFAGSASGRPEIFAVGLRNPWRFSFDRATGRLYAGDVGQGQVEEVSIVPNGGNLGWRVMEGNRCTGLGPASCASPGFVPPIATYTHSQGRCSITGGYVYRGRRGSLPLGSYVYGDYCTGEVFVLSAGTQSLLADTSYSISSFGEDESGELYVVGHAGTIHRIVNPDAPAPSTAYFPYLRIDQGQAGGSDEFTGVAVTNLDGMPATLTFRAYSPEGTLVQGAEVTNPRTLELPGLAQVPLVATQIFGRGLPAAMPDGWMSLEGSNRHLTSFFLTFDSRLSLLDGTPTDADTLTRFVLPDTGTPEATRIRVANPGADSVQLDIELIGGDGTAKGSVSRTIAGRGVLASRLRDLFPAATESDYLRFTSTQGVAPVSVVFDTGRFARALPGLDATGGGTRLYCPQYVVGGGYRSELYVVNLDAESGDVTFRLFGDSGAPLGTPRTVSIAGQGKVVVSGAAFFGDFGGALTQGFVEIRSSGIRLAGNVVYGDAAGAAFSAALPLVTETARRLVFGQVASDATYYTGVAIVNPGAESTTAALEVFDGTGASLGATTFGVPARGRVSGLLTELLPGLIGTKISSGSIRVTAEGSIASFAVFGTTRLDTLSAIPGTDQ